MNMDKIWAESIAKEYAPKDSSKIVALKKLDRKAKLPAEVFAYSFGIGTMLLAGLGMCLAMQVIGAGVIGFAGCGVTYPVYKRLLKKGKEKYAHEIVELAKEISAE